MSIKSDRRHHRKIYWLALGKFRELTLIACHASAVPLVQISSGGIPGNSWRELNTMWRYDFVASGMRVLSGREKQIFSLHHIMGLSVRGTMRKLRISSRDSFADWEKLVAEKVGSELKTSQLWPIKKYRCPVYFMAGKSPELTQAQVVTGRTSSEGEINNGL